MDALGIKEPWITLDLHNVILHARDRLLDSQLDSFWCILSNIYLYVCLVTRRCKSENPKYFPRSLVTVKPLLRLMDLAREGVTFLEKINFSFFHTDFLVFTLKYHRTALARMKLFSNSPF